MITEHASSFITRNIDKDVIEDTLRVFNRRIPKKSGAT